ncbi:nitrogenase iron protein [Acetitomaculum ruminis DSM 5522]|uniref:nitrogenase n=1 Tax=Acetitomaculum ruminis DSM 5522 TaxID=1120918 RepID=A0A1I0X9K6_9FIRM|nr:nitrogenase component 1 [Acetitomaculum ruminis]SFA97020.1 nitrogenase iron protein [Acetitomaculum ruminis DSM 5522]
MNKNKIEFAVYGKGGIGKSTISANISAALAIKGNKVMQIGCDPKHDSTRYLMHGEIIPTVVEYLRKTPEDKALLSDVLRKGCFGIKCIEAGGPRPGVGCAGRGVISAFEFLKKHHAKDDCNRILYDVLGDVVCGGFAVPVRKEYADAVFLVTSGEYMSLYAANNILRGVRNYDGENGKRVAGIIYNERKISDEDGRVNRFAKAVNLPIIVKVPRSNAFSYAEEENMTVMEIEGFEAEKEIFTKIADYIDGQLPLYKALPLDDDELENVVLGTEKRRKVFEEKSTDNNDLVIKSDIDNKDFSDSCLDNSLKEEVPERMPLYGCAFNGATTEAIHVRDAYIIAHAPKACSFYAWQNITSPGRRNLFNRGILMPSSLNPNFFSTNMNHADAVFGGMDKLRKKVTEALLNKPKLIIVISSCVSGIIGDDIKQIEEMSTKDTLIIAINADGDIEGDYMKGIEMCRHILMEKLANKDIIPCGKFVNIINETGVSNNSSINFNTIKSFLDKLGIEINCRLGGDTTTQNIINFKKASLNLIADDNPTGRMLESWLKDNYQVNFIEKSFPIGFKQTVKWLNELAEFFNCKDKLYGIVENQKEIYEKEIAMLKPVLNGKTILMTTINTNLDWLISACKDVGMKFVWIGVINYLHQDIMITEDSKIKVEEYTHWDTAKDYIKKLHPDLVISNHTQRVGAGDYVAEAIPMTLVCGFQSGINILKRWAKLFETKRNGEWMNDKALFEKYFA